MTISLITLVTELAYRLDDLKAFPINGATASTVTPLGIGTLTTNASADTYNGAWVYAENQQRRVRGGGFAPSTSIVTLASSWTTVPTVGGTVYFTRLAPIGTAGAPGEDTPYKVHVQQALRHLVYPDLVTLAITSSDSYSLGTYQYWLTPRERFVGLREPHPTSGRRPVDANWRLADPPVERSGTSLLLRLNAPFAAGVSGSLTLDVMRPPYTLVSGSESVTGPTTDAHTVEANPDDVLCGALAFFYLSMAVRQVSSPDGGDWSQRYEAQRAEFEALTAYDRTRKMPTAPVREAA